MGLRQSRGNGDETALLCVVRDRHVLPRLQLFQRAIVPLGVAVPTVHVQIAIDHVDLAASPGRVQDAADLLMTRAGLLGMGVVQVQRQDAQPPLADPGRFEVNRSDGPPDLPWQVLPVVELDLQRQPRGDELLALQHPRQLLRVYVLQLRTPRLLNASDVVAERFEDVDQPLAAAPRVPGQQQEAANRRSEGKATL